MNLYNFDSLIGNTVTLTLLKRSISNKTLGRFLILGGTLGTGKSTSAKIIALALTCENCIDGQPCCTCKSCLATMASFESTGESRSVKIVNAGKLEDRSAINRLIRDIFVLQSGLGNTVFIIEEAHALNKIDGAQTALLEELDRMPENTYVIMCTTKISQILPEIQSRALTFHFNRLNPNESRLLLQLAADKLGIKNLSNRTESTLLASSKGIPRNLIKSLEFIVANQVSEEELKNFLQQMDDSTFIQLFESFKDSDASTIITAIESLFANYDTEIVIKGLKDFFLRVLFFIEGNIKECFTKSECEDIRLIFTEEIMYQLLPVIEKLNVGTSDADCKLSFLRMRSILQGKSFSALLSNNKTVAAAEKIKAERMGMELHDLGFKAEEYTLNKLTTKSVQAFKDCL